MTDPEQNRTPEGPKSRLKELLGKFGVLGVYEAALLISVALGGTSQMTENKNIAGEKNEAPSVKVTGRLKREFEDKQNRDQRADEAEKGADVRKAVDAIGEAFGLNEKGVGLLVDLAGKCDWSAEAIQKFASPELQEPMQNVVTAARNDRFEQLKLEFGTKKDETA